MTRPIAIPGGSLGAALPRLDELRLPEPPPVRAEELRMRRRAPAPLPRARGRRDAAGGARPPREPSPEALAALSAATARLSPDRVSAAMQGLTPEARAALAPQLEAVAAMMATARELVGMREQVGALVRAQGQG